MTRILAALLLTAIALVAWRLLGSSIAAPEPVRSPDQPNATAVVSPERADPPVSDRALASTTLEELATDDESATSGPARQDQRPLIQIDGPSDLQYPGVAVLSWPTGPKATVPITEREWRIPTSADDGRGAPTHADIAFPGFCKATVRVPISDQIVVELHLLRAGSIALELVDRLGFVLPQRTIYCYGAALAAPSPFYTLSTSSYGVADDAGKVTIEQLIPGEYRLVLAGLVEWSEVIVDGVPVNADQVTYRRLEVPVLPPDSFGGFTMPFGQQPFDDDGGVGELGAYRFHTDDGQRHKVYRTPYGYRCVVPCQPEAQLRGRIAWRQGKLVPEGSYESSEITVTNGAVVAVNPDWKLMN